MTYSFSTKPNCFIFDIDGTLADCSHRQPLVRGDKKDWDTFNMLMYKDKPIDPVFRVLRCILKDYKVFFVTGRECTTENLKYTLEFLEGNLDIDIELNKNLFMRDYQDYGCDNIAKKHIVDTYIKPVYNIVGIFDDRFKVVNMWREEGYYVFDCNQTREVF